MLTQLTIRNFGLIDEISIEFINGFNILTGETGAGKSILIDALRSVLGERLDASSIRDPKNPCVIEAVFDFPDRQLIIQRFFSASGTGKIKIDGLSATVSELKELGNSLIDFHGP